MEKALKILLADDDQSVLNNYGQFFIVCGFDVTTAKNGAECIELLQKETFHVAVLDIFMPPINGLEVAKYIQAERIDTDVVLLTGNASLEVAVTAIRAGVKDLFEKFKSDKDKGELLNKIKSLIKDKKNPTSIRAEIENKFKANMSESIDLIENKLRTVIEKMLKESHGDKYWKTTIPGDIQEKVKKRIKEQIKKFPWLKPSPDETSFNKWDFCDVGDYLKIILKNWNLFSELFAHKEGLSQHFNNFSSVRNSVKHNREMNEVESKLGEASIIWFSRTLGIS
jgi:CheY-like chemotaxis protein